MNFRDFGGLPAHAGRGVVAGRLYRSATLGALNAHDFTRLRALGIRLVCDLRHECVSRLPSTLYRRA